MHRCASLARTSGASRTPQGSGRGIRTALKGGGGTATAYHLLAELLQERPDTHVSFLGATKDIEACQSAQKVFLCR